MTAKPPRELDVIADAILAYKPKPKTKAAKRRTRRKKYAFMRPKTVACHLLTGLIGSSGGITMPNANDLLQHGHYLCICGCNIYVPDEMD